MKSEFISIGDELLDGKTVNTNASWLARELSSLGYAIARCVMVKDVSQNIILAVRESLERSPATLIITGGLGPTSDDITVFALAKALGLEVKRSLKRYQELLSFYGVDSLSDSQASQAYVIPGAELFASECGSASGFVIPYKQDSGEVTLIICLPGPPKELRSMFFASVRAYLADHKQSTVAHSTVGSSWEYLIYGVSESGLQDMLDPFLQTHAASLQHVGIYLTREGIRLKIDIQDAAQSPASSTESCASSPRNDLLQILGDHVVSEYSHHGSPRHASLGGVVASKLMAKQQSLVVAESCSAGSLAACLGEVVGVSKVLLGGFVVYSLHAKEVLLGLDSELLQRDEGVSFEIAMLMAKKARVALGSHWALSITGWAGAKVLAESSTTYPAQSRDREQSFAKEKPGEVYIGVSWSQEVVQGFSRKEFAAMQSCASLAIQRRFSPVMERKGIQRQAALEALFAMNLLLKESPWFFERYGGDALCFESVFESVFDKI